MGGRRARPLRACLLSLAWRLNGSCATATARPQVPIEKVFNKSLLSKFNWCMDVEMTFRF